MIKLTAIFYFLFVHHALGAVALKLPAANTSRYDIKDLEVLENEKSYAEFFHHAKDIRPSLRNKHWNQMVSSMAMELFEGLKKKSIVTETDVQMVLHLSDWPTLKADEFFIKQRNPILLSYFSNCFNKNDWNTCYQLSYDFYTSHDQGPIFGINLAKMLSKKSTLQNTGVITSATGIMKHDLWPFVSPMAKNTLGEFYCNKAPIKNIIINKLYAVSMKDDSNKILNSNKLIHQDCWKGISKDLKADMLGSTDKFLRYQSYNIISKFENISQNERYQYVILQTLDAYPFNKNEIFHNWHTLKRLGDNSKVRLRIFNKIKAMDPLPGSVFAQTGKKNLALVKSLARFFPEYLDYYSSTCLNYLEGTNTKLFPNGNPTINCHELFKSAGNFAKLNPNSSAILLPNSKLLKYHEIMNFWK